MPRPSRRKTTGRLVISGDGPQQTLHLRPGPPSPSRTYLTAHEVLHANPRWTARDREVIKSFLEGSPQLLTYTPNVWDRSAVDAIVRMVPDQLASVYRTGSSPTMIGLDARGRKIFEIRPGSIRLGRDAGREVLKLSTAPGRGARTPRRPATPRSQINKDPVSCPVHHIQLPATGQCDLCS